MSRHKSFAKIWLAYWLVKPMVPCRKFLGRAKTHGSGARPPSQRAALGKDPYLQGLRAGGWGSLPPPLPRSARRTRPGRPAG